MLAPPVVGGRPVVLGTGLLAVLVLVHVRGARLVASVSIPRAPFLSAAGGVAVGFVFGHIFPEIQRMADQVQMTRGVGTVLVEEIYLVVLLGFVTYYGLEAYVRHAAGRSSQGGIPEGSFWLHVGSFGLYNAIIGYLLVDTELLDPVGAVLFALAMALHFLVNDVALRAHHESDYRNFGRYVISVAVLVGGVLGYVVSVPVFWLATLFAFLGGGVVLNAIKEELPAERESHFWPFAIAACGYTALFVLV